MDPRRPFDPSRAPFFYGWVIVGAATLGMIASVPGQTMGVSVFTDHLIDATGLSRLSLANAYLSGTLASGLMIPKGGQLFDRWGARRVGVYAALGAALALCLMSQVDRVGGAVGGVLGDPGWWTMFAVVAASFACLRFFAQGMLPMISRAMLGKWFNKRRGLASGVMGIFVAFGFAIAPRVFLPWIELSGWRGAWLQIGGFVLAFAFVAYLLYRDNPEEVSLRMDGAPPEDDDEAAAQTEIALTRSQAIRSSSFWMVALALGSQALVITGVVFHIVNIGAGAGMTEKEVVGIFIPMAIINTIVGFIGGALADRVPVKFLVATMMLGQICGLLGVAYFNTDVGYLLCIGGLSIGGGFFAPIATVALPRFFGRAHLGAISGALSMAIVIASAMGPSVLATSERMTGGYRTSLLALLVLPALALVVAAISKPPLASQS